MEHLTEWLNPQEVSKRYGLSTSNLAKWRMTRKNLPFFKDGRYIKYKVSDIENYLENNKVEVAK